MTKKEKLETILKKVTTPEEYEAYSIVNLSKGLEKSKASFSDYIKQIEERFKLSDGSLSGLEKVMSKKFENLEIEMENRVKNSSDKGVSLIKTTEKYLLSEINSVDSILRKAITKEIKATREEIDDILKKIKKDIEELFWLRTSNGSNNVQAVLNIKNNGTFIANNVTGLNFIGATPILNADGTVTVTITGGGSGTWYQDEIVATGQTGTSFSLLHTPTAVVLLYKNGQYLVSGASYDYTISGANITLQTSLLATDLLTATYS